MSDFDKKISIDVMLQNKVDVLEAIKQLGLSEYADRAVELEGRLFAAHDALVVDMATAKANSESEVKGPRQSFSDFNSVSDDIRTLFFEVSRVIGMA